MTITSKSLVSEDLPYSAWMFMYVHVCVCSYCVQGCMCTVYKCILRLDNTLGCHALGPPTLCLEMGSFTGWAGWLASEPPSPIPNVGIITIYHHTQIFMWVLGSNSGPRVYVTNILLSTRVASFFRNEFMYWSNIFFPKMISTVV